MFRFDFDLDDEVDVETLDISSLKITEEKPAPTSPEPVDLHSLQEITISQLLDALPPALSYSPLQIPLSSDAEALVFARRDLFDARFQLLCQNEDANDALHLFESPSDLTTGVYEGGFKTWECSLDLVNYMEGNEPTTSTSSIGKRILEIGCGTAVPAMYLLRKILSSSPVKDGPQTSIHLQDYNASVLELFTLPNLLLVWYMSRASLSYISSESLSIPDPSLPSELNVTPELKSAFLQSLQEYNISLQFFSGSWDAFNLKVTNSSQKAIPYDLVLTSETIYSMASLPCLVTLLRSACLGDEINPGGTHQRHDEESNNPCICLVAAKMVYFGVGGGVVDFTTAVEERNGRVKTAWETTTGVKRKVLSVTWQRETRGRLHHQQRSTLSNHTKQEEEDIV